MAAGVGRVPRWTFKGPGLLHPAGWAHDCYVNTELIAGRLAHLLRGTLLAAACTNHFPSS